jgi:hypothetical protein
MKLPARLLALTLLTLTASSAAFATSAADIVKAQKILSTVIELTSKYQAVTGKVTAPTPLANTNGKFLVPYGADGMLTEWANKTLSTQVGAAIGAKAGEEAGKQLASRVPFGGLASGLIKKKGKEMGAVAAIGGVDFMKKTSAISFNNLDDYAVYLHVTHANSGDYTRALAAAMAVYPELENRYDDAVKAAFQKADKAATVAAKSS